MDEDSPEGYPQNEQHAVIPESFPDPPVNKGFQSASRPASRTVKTGQRKVRARHIPQPK